MNRRVALCTVVTVTVTVLLAAVGGPEPAEQRAPAAATATPIVLAAAHDDDGLRELARLRRAQRADRGVERAGVPAAVVAPDLAPARAVVVVPKVKARVRAAVPRPGRAAPPGPGAAAPGGGGRAGVVVGFALSQLGKPYVRGAAGPGGYDCSGLLVAAFARVGIRLPHQSGQIRAKGRFVPAGQWQAGDVLHWQGHVALYIGGGRMVSASRRGVPVKVAPVYGSPTGWRLL